MARSLIGGLIADGYHADSIWASNLLPEPLQDLCAQFGIKTTTDNYEAAKHADIVVLSVKPQALKAIALELSTLIQAKKCLVISIAAGIRETSIQNWLGNNIPIVRCMPNTPALVRTGATALYANQYVNHQQKNLAESILRAVGITVWVENEIDLDTVTALSGSGPAYFFLVIEALEKAAIELGLTEKTAHLLTLQTALGSAKMALESSQPIIELRNQVTSPGGTTERALHILEQNQLAKIFQDAIKAAQQRANELADLLGE